MKKTHRYNNKVDRNFLTDLNRIHSRSKLVRIIFSVILIGLISFLSFYGMNTKTVEQDIDLQWQAQYNYPNQCSIQFIIAQFNPEYTYTFNGSLTVGFETMNINQNVIHNDVLFFECLNDTIISAIEQGNLSINLRGSFTIHKSLVVSIQKIINDRQTIAFLTDWTWAYQEYVNLSVDVIPHCRIQYPLGNYSGNIEIYYETKFILSSTDTDLGSVSAGEYSVLTYNESVPYTSMIFIQNARYHDAIKPATWGEILRYRVEYYHDYPNATYGPARPALYFCNLYIRLDNGWKIQFGDRIVDLGSAYTLYADL